MKEKNEDQGTAMSNEEIRFVEIAKENPIKLLKGLTRHDLIKPLIWVDSNCSENPMSLVQLATKYGITKSQVRTILKNIKNNS
jgi:hypothetical protein